MIGAAALALPVAVVLLLLARLDGGLRRSAAHLPLAAGLAVGTSSLVWWALFWVPAPPRARLWIDLAFWVLALAAVCRLRTHRVAAAGPPAGRGRWTIRVAVALFLPLAALAAARFVSATAVLPHGTWDAWAIWNLRARFLLRGYPGLWHDGFSALLHWSHPDYPLLVPLSVARGWTCVGMETTGVPILISASFALAAVSAAAVSVARVRGTARGLLAAAAILASPAFVEQASGQIADVPLGFYMLASFVTMFNAAAAGPRSTWWVLAGLSAGLAAWTKNEGVLFLTVFLAACAWWSFRSRGLRGLTGVALVLSGAAPSLAALAVLKWGVAAPDLLIAGQSAEHVAESLADTARIRVAATALGREMWLGGGQRVGVLPIVAGCLLLSGARRPLGVPGVAAAAMLVMLFGYVGVYVVTPYDLTWHVSTSVKRVALQLFPTFVWFAFMAARLPDGGPETGRASATLGNFEPDGRPSDAGA